MGLGQNLSWDKLYILTWPCRERLSRKLCRKDSILSVSPHSSPDLCRTKWQESQTPGNFNFSWSSTLNATPVITPFNSALLQGAKKVTALVSSCMVWNARSRWTEETQQIITSSPLRVTFTNSTVPTSSPPNLTPHMDLPEGKNPASPKISLPLGQTPLYHHQDTAQTRRFSPHLPPQLIHLFTLNYFLSLFQKFCVIHHSIFTQNMFHFSPFHFFSCPPSSASSDLPEGLCVPHSRCTYNMLHFSYFFPVRHLTPMATPAATFNHHAMQQKKCVLVSGCSGCYMII